MANLNEFFCTLNDLVGLPLSYFYQRLVIAFLPEIESFCEIRMKSWLDQTGLDELPTERRNNTNSD
jgi:hypothetical protein